ncbi:MAG: colicin production protein [Proteobacteria bacterium]|nr:colicin production protein [Pseudomonadota bacterium]MBS1172777.1 colicin production protein [Pseudomonadota bacterium]
MTVFDYGVVAVLGLTLLLGFWRGLVSEILALAAWVVAFFAARATASEVGRLFADVLKDQAVQYVVGFAAVFVGVLVVFALLRLAVTGVLAAAGLGVLDRFLGGVFGAVQGLAVLLALVVAGGLTSLPQQPWWRDAVSAPPLETAALATKPYLPPELAKRIRYR